MTLTIEARVTGADGTHGDTFIAINDAVLHKGGFARVIRLAVHVGPDQHEVGTVHRHHQGSVPVATLQQVLSKATQRLGHFCYRHLSQESCQGGYRGTAPQTQESAPAAADQAPEPGPGTTSAPGDPAEPEVLRADDFPQADVFE